MTAYPEHTHETIRWAVLEDGEPLENALSVVRSSYMTHEEALASIARRAEHIRDRLEVVRVTKRVERLGVRP